ncbi:MAG: LysM domain-containing protein [Gemmatimonadales bacterium]
MAVHVTASGEEIIHLRRRFIPPPERFQLLQIHTITEGERHDNLAARFLGDPEQFWRLCDANAVLRPEELTETPGSRVRITLPEGIAGTPNA